MPAELKPFSGDEAECPKCLNVGASTEYREQGQCLHGHSDEVIGWETNERLHRACRRCGYAWDEALAVRPVDQCACIGTDCAKKGCWVKRTAEV